MLSDATSNDDRVTLMGYPFKGRPTYLALAPLTHAAGVLCFSHHDARSRVVIMHIRTSAIPQSDRALPGHSHILPPTVIYMLLVIRSSKALISARCNAFCTARHRFRWRA